MLLCLLLWYPGKEKKNKEEHGWLWYPKYYRICKQIKTQESLLCSHWGQHHVSYAGKLHLGIRPGERVDNSKCREWWKATLPPPPASGIGPSVPRELLSPPQPGSWCIHFMQLSTWCSLFYVYWQNQSPPLHDLWANISFTDQDLQQPQLGLYLLVFIVFFRHRSAVFFLHVPSILSEKIIFKVS